MTAKLPALIFFFSLWAMLSALYSNDFALAMAWLASASGWAIVVKTADSWINEKANIKEKP